jgi:hypothetical protein
MNYKVLKVKKIVLLLLLFFTSQVLFSQDTKTSSKGSIQFKSKDYFFAVGLVDNYKEVLAQWDNPDLHRPPSIPAKSVFSVGDSVVPFLAFSILNKDKLQNELYYNIKLKNPLGKISQNQKDKLLIKGHKVDHKMIYRTNQLYGWTFEPSDPRGEYTIYIEIYDSQNYKQHIELMFQLK